MEIVDKHIDKDIVLPENEAERQAKLEEYNILDTLPENEFDSLVELAALVTGSPVSLINLLDYDRQWTKAAYGADTGNTPRSDTVCQYTVMGDENFEIQDLTKNEKFKDMPYVTGDPKYRSYSGHPLKTEEGYNIGALCVLDYKPKKLTKVQKKALATISDEIISRLELRKQKHELEKLNRQKDHFLRAVNHDIKSPLNGIIGSTNYLQNNWDGDREELQQFLSMIELSGRKLINYTGELLSNSLQQGESKLILDEVQVDKLVTDLIDIYKPLAKAKNIEVKTHLNTPQKFHLDNEKFKLILSNLISNALKFCSSGDTITIFVDIIVKHNTTLYCKISDTGIGIPKEFIPELFEMKESHQRKGTYGEISTGLGLPIVKDFVELHNGDVHVESTEGVGTTFHVVLPEN